MSTFKNEVISFGLGTSFDKGFARISGGSLRTDIGMPADFFMDFKQTVSSKHRKIAKCGTNSGYRPNEQYSAGRYKIQRHQ